MTTYLSVCSGIEAATVAWHALGWEPVGFSEIEAFPSAVLAHHYPHVPNYGDMTALAARILSGEIEAPDILVGGTPCQAFSVAGLRAGLADPRGALTLAFQRLADAIDHVRRAAGKRPCVIVWENVPGVLSSKDNAFGCFLGAMVGEDDELQPTGNRWSDAGAVYGPARTVAWRILDAQYFGLAQRRRRVFVVASDGTIDPCEVLFERDRVRRDFAPRREAGEGAAGTAAARAGGGDRPDGGDGQHSQLIAMGSGQAGAEILDDGGAPTLTCLHEAPIIAGSLCAADGKGANGQHADDHKLVVAHTLRGEGYDASEDGTGRGTPLVPISFHWNAQPDQQTFLHDHVGTLTRSQEAAVLAFDTTQVTSPANRSNPKPGDPCHPLAAGAHAPAVAFQTRGQDRVDVQEEVAYALLASGGNGGRRHEMNISASMQVRRLTPRECERLQGFPDDYTAIPWRGKPAKGQERARAQAAAGDERFAEIDGVMWVVSADGPRYKALGNSMAVPVMRWIGRRVAEVLP